MRRTFVKSGIAAGAAMAVVVLSLSVLWGANDGPKGQPRIAPPKPTLVINLTSGEANLHAAAMGLHFAEHGLADGREVVIFFNVASPPLARKNLAESIKFKDMPPIRSMIAKLQEGGAKMVVCPMCAEATDIKAEELAPGVEMIKDRKQIFDHLHENSVVFTY